MLQRGGILLGGDHQSGAARQAGEQACRLGENILQPPAAAGHARLDDAAFLGIEVANFQKPVHEKPQALFRGHPPGAGMGRIKQAHCLQVRHHIADGGRRQGQGQALGQGP